MMCQQSIRHNLGAPRDSWRYLEEVDNAFLRQAEADPRGILQRWGRRGRRGLRGSSKVTLQRLGREARTLTKSALQSQPDPTKKG
eukprot:scaffold244289_cov15-Prasinocladus_malaysianus.AAC.1